MLFSSHVFIFGFLPITLVFYHVTRTMIGGKAALGVLLLASLVFYGWWNPPYLLLLGGSMAVNYGFVRALGRYPSRAVLWLGVTLNLLLLGYFKYRNFFLENVGYLVGESWQFEPIFVPLAISFFTFQQIALLCDVADGKTKPRDALDFFSFVSLFPQLIAGPIVLFREMSDQFADLRGGKGPGISLLGPGLVIFSLGLFKKIVLADSLSPYADIAFTHAQSLTLMEAWGAALTYSLQLYFDFSGYSDMAVGLGLMLGFALPVNFARPFRATSMIEFWKRWHITMTRFFMMYLYSPIALSLGRMSVARQLSGKREFIVTVTMPILITFLLSGLWHGAAWTFVAFGAVNGIGLIVNHAWRKAKLARLPDWLGWALAMLTVMVSFVYFRAESMSDAHAILGAMLSPSDFALPFWLSGLADTIGVPWRSMEFFATGSYTVRLFTWLVILAPLSLLLPDLASRREALTPGWGMAASVAVMFAFSIALLDRPQAFIYFQF